MKSEEEIEANVNEEGSIYNQDLEQLNVNVWFNKLEHRLQYCLTKDNSKEGFEQYRLLVKHVELLAIASNKIDEKEYLEEVEELISKDIDKYEEETVLGMREAMIKYRIILKALLKVKSTSTSLVYKN